MDSCKVMQSPSTFSIAPTASFKMVSAEGFEPSTFSKSLKRRLKGLYVSRRGFEPLTFSLRGNCSTVELPALLI